jgi:hypothetical protein
MKVTYTAQPCHAIRHQHTSPPLKRVYGEKQPTLPMASSPTTFTPVFVVSPQVQVTSTEPLTSPGICNGNHHSCVPSSGRQLSVISQKPTDAQPDMGALFSGISGHTSITLLLPSSQYVFPPSIINTSCSHSHCSHTSRKRHYLSVDLAKPRHPSLLLSSEMQCTTVNSKVINGSNILVLNFEGVGAVWFSSCTSNKLRRAVFSKPPIKRNRCESDSPYLELV